VGGKRPLAQALSPGVNGFASRNIKTSRGVRVYHELAIDLLESHSYMERSKVEKEDMRNIP
jgi:hypothetical protein